MGRETEKSGRILARPVAGGEEKETREREEVMAHLLVYLDRVRGGRRGLVGVRQGAAAEVNDDGGAPTGKTARMRAG